MKYNETIRLFDEDSRLEVFEACVLACEEDKDGYKVVLNQTAFFPEEGGQTCDQGTLQDIPVEKVMEENKVIYHWLKEPLWEGDTVTGVIDWKKRFSDMQQHSGEHIVSGLMHEYHHLDNVGFHLGSECVTMDFNGVITEEELQKIEYKANEAVAANLKIRVTWPSQEELAELPYRSKKPLEGPIRIVEIPGYDICACCAPHVTRTGEIGIIKLIGMEKYKGGIRVSMLCGFRALADYREKEKSVRQISVLLSAKSDQIADAVRRQKEENTCLKSELNLLKTAIIEEKVSHLPESSGALCFFEERLDKTNIRKVWTLLKEKTDSLCGCFAGNDETGYHYVIGSKTLDVSIEGRKLNEALGGRGGGSAEMFQGSLPAARSAIEDYFKSI
jgi:alanyl-tRNA synthetase